MADTPGTGLPSRYHSQRRKHAANDAVTTPEPPSSPPSGSAVGRSKSRYRRKQTASPPTTSTNETEQQASAIPTRYHSKHHQSTVNAQQQENAIQTQHPLPRNTLPERCDDSHTARVRGITPESKNTASNQPNIGVASSEPRLDPTRESNERRTATATSSRPFVTPAQQPGELFPPPTPTLPLPRFDGPPQSGNIRATKSMSELRALNSEADSGCLGGLFKRKKEGPSLDKDHISRPLTSKGSPTARKVTAALGTDAPISAINAGDRRVQVKCGKSKAMFPVTPLTTPADLIKSAATCMSERIDVKSALMFEYFGTVGVQRPLRRYERIRNVMNSWNDDEENVLLIADPGTGTVEPELTLAGAPKEAPHEQSWLLQYSQKVGTWNKRWITLRESGQIVGQKDLEKIKDLVNICHLSDFDIYTPSPEKLKKKIKPPKKLCFAVKSQEKTSLFESTDNFVHFFATGDRRTADTFYQAIQTWRSWYLVSVLGEGSKEKPQPAPADAPPRKSMSNDQSHRHRVKESVDSHYHLGSFKPLMSLDQFDQPLHSNGAADERMSVGLAKAEPREISATQEQRVVSERRQHPPVSLKNRGQLAEDEPLANLQRESSISKARSSSEQRTPSVAAEFSETGLLGRSYSQRRKEIAEQEVSQEDGFMVGPNLLNGGLSSHEDGYPPNEGVTRRSSTRRPGDSNDNLQHSRSVRQTQSRGSAPRGGGIGLDRSASRRQKPKPLVDLTPEFKDPLQYTSKGRSFQPDYIGQGGLIESATTPEDPLGLPSNNVVRSTNAVPAGRQRTGSMPEKPVQRQSSIRQAPEGFTGEGLLAYDQNRQGWGGANKGRGVIDGTRAGGRPLVNLAQDSRFVPGSLLNQVEQAEGGPMQVPLIDREKRQERVEKYGEGF